MTLIILLLPLMGFISGGLLGRFLGKNGVTKMTLLTTMSSLFLSIFLLFQIVYTGNVIIVDLLDWISVDFLRIEWSFCFDSLTCSMLVIVTFISSLVHLYSIEYMKFDPHLPRFMSYLSLFTFFMLILVTANNFLQMFVGWEGVGVSSYLLINFWFTRIQANKSAIKAMLVNRVGDFFLLLALFTIYMTFKTFNYDTIFSLSSLVSEVTVNYCNVEINILDIICIFIFLGAMGKSAQIGLHTWLPDAMEGPTPVSALIHAATMVTAGVFLIIRTSFLFEYSYIALILLTIIGSMTAFFAATTGLFQNDMKRVIAYSTCSQLGYMVFACGLSGYEVSFFHLSNHAFFKALLFLAAGAVIHALSDEQDMRKMGGLKNILPFSYAVSLIGSLALIGFPYLSGFYSKDIILEISASHYTYYGTFSYILGILSAFCTAFYSTRLLYLVFLGNTNANKNIILNAHEGSIFMSLPLFLLSILSITVGYLSKDLFIGFGTDFWGNSIYIKPENYFLLDVEFLSFYFKILPFFFTIFGVFIAYYVYSQKLFFYFKIKKNSIFYYYINIFFNKKWYFDRVYNQLIIEPTLLISYSFFYQSVDRGLLEQVGPINIVKLLEKVAQITKNHHNGSILNYLSYYSFFIIFIFLVYAFSYLPIDSLVAGIILSFYYFLLETSKLNVKNYAKINK